MRAKNGQEFTQCKDCMVTTSQTKLGVAIQLLWNHPVKGWGRDVRCSIDLIPIFSIREIKESEVTGIVNRGLFSKRPPGWFKTLVDYVNRNRKMSDDKESVTDAVMVKMINYCREDYTYIRPSWKEGPSQALMTSSKRTNVYCMIKAMLAGFKDIDEEFTGVDKFMTKQVLASGMLDTLEKELKGEEDNFHLRRKVDGEDQEVWERPRSLTGRGQEVWGRNEEGMLLYLVLQQPFFRDHFEEVIDYAEWDEIVAKFRASSHKRWQNRDADIFIPLKVEKQPEQPMVARPDYSRTYSRQWS